MIDKRDADSVTNKEAEQWRRVKTIFDKAVDLCLPARESFLLEVCGANTGLREEVEALLNCHDKAGDFIASPIFAALSNNDEKIDSWTGKSIGSYRVVRELGRGG